MDRSDRRRIVSGGQTGVDRAALDAAMEAGLEVGGWCPAGRRAADGVIPARYSLRETPSPEYEQRTEWNVRDSEATLILYRPPLMGGTTHALTSARRLGKPCLLVDLSRLPLPQREVLAWLRKEGVRVLNVAGPREETHPGIYQQARSFLAQLFRAWQD